MNDKFEANLRMILNFSSGISNIVKIPLPIVKILMDLMEQPINYILQ